MVIKRWRIVCINAQGDAIDENRSVFWKKWETTNHVSEPMQFTGFVDKSGREIYEGDIIKIKTVDEETIISPIYFWHGTYCIKHGKDYLTLIHVDIEYDWEEYRPYYEVIGNIYENPELI